MNLLESPKKKFQKTPQAKVHADLVVSPQFQSTLDAALLQMQYEMGSASDLNTAAANAFRLEGARRFMATLLTLAETPTTPRRNTGDNLNENA